MFAQWAWFALFLGMMFGLGAGLAWAMDDGPVPTAASPAHNIETNNV